MTERHCARSLGGAHNTGPLTFLVRRTNHEQITACAAVNLRTLLFVVVAGAAIAVVQALTTLLVLVVAILLLWAVCFRTREVLVTIGSLVGAYLLATYPGWFVALAAFLACSRWIERSNQASPTNMLPPPNGDQPHR